MSIDFVAPLSLFLQMQLGNLLQCWVNQRVWGSDPLLLAFPETMMEESILCGAFSGQME